MKNFLIKHGKYFWVLPLIVSALEWYRISFKRNASLFIAIMMSGLTYYFWGVGTGRIIDKDIKPFKDDEE